METFILIVDDDVLTLELYQKSLPKTLKKAAFARGYNSVMESVQVVGVDSVTAAIQQLREHQIDILIVDLKLPSDGTTDFGGLDIVSESIKLDPFRPVIALTGYHTLELMRRTFQQGVFDFIVKSVDAGDNLANSILDALAKRNQRLVLAGNPFRPQSGVSPVVFGGRKKEIDFLEQRLMKSLIHKVPEHFMIVGDWGMGKTTMLREFKKICQSRGYIAVVVPIECPAKDACTATIVHSLIQGIVRSLPYPVDTFKRLLAFFQAAGIKIWNVQLEFKAKEKADEISPMMLLHDALKNMSEDLEGRSKMLVLLFDDMENLFSCPHVLRLIQQALAMDSIQNASILIGTAFSSRNLENQPSETSVSSFSRSFNFRLQLELLGKNDLVETIQRLLYQTGVQFSNDVVEKIFHYTQGHPFEMQVICYHLFEKQMSGRVGLEVWDSAFGCALTDLGNSAYLTIISSLSQPELDLLKEIVAHDSTIFARNVCGTKGVLEYAAKSLHGLEAKGIVRKNANGTLCISDRLFGAYVIEFT